jgi:hypothetical protein
MAKGPLRIRDAAGHAVRKLTVWISGLEKDVASSPDIQAGTGAPSHTPVDGSLWLRTDGGASTALYVRENSAWVLK